MKSRVRIRAIPAPADAVLPQAAAIGVLMLDTRFPRLPGDIGHPAAFGAPVVHAVVEGAWPSRVVTTASALRGGGLAPLFVEAARALRDLGVGAITTSCGFLVLLQDELQAAVDVPVVTSSLLQLPALLAREQRVGVLTIDAAQLGPDHFAAAGVPAARLVDLVVQGMPRGGAFAGPILGNGEAMVVEAAREEVVAAARGLAARDRSLRTAVLECTNLPPHAPAAARASGLQLLSLLDDPRLGAG